MKILTEDDYLDAHLTVIREEFRGRNLTPHNFKERPKLTINRPGIERVPKVARTSAFRRAVKTAKS